MSHWSAEIEVEGGEAPGSNNNNKTNRDKCPGTWSRNSTVTVSDSSETIDVLTGGNLDGRYTLEI